MDNELILTSEFCRVYNVSQTFITELHEAGIISVVNIKEQHYFHCDQLKELEKLARLHLDMNINLEGIEAIAHLLRQMESLQSELAAIKQRLNFYE